MSKLILIRLVIGLVAILGLTSLVGMAQATMREINYNDAVRRVAGGECSCIVDGTALEAKKLQIETAAQAIRKSRGQGLIKTKE